MEEIYWSGKTILWLGTSIPEGKDTALGSLGSGQSYPEAACALLGASCINEALGSSMCRANTRFGDYRDAKTYNLLRAFSQTLEEKERLIADWDCIRHRLRDPDTSPQLSEEEKAVVRGASFEARLLPYLNGTRPMPDLFVLDHGHNDFKYTLADGATDIDLAPCESVIANGTLAPDTYMTRDGYAGLTRFFGPLDHVPKLSAFASELNRNCYLGAMNFICTLILHCNPRARIVFVSNYESYDKISLIAAQKHLAESWHFPLLEVWRSLGFSGHIIPGTAHYWGDSGCGYTGSDLSAQRIYCKDSTHPHSDETGDALRLYARALANALRFVV